MRVSPPLFPLLLTSSLLLAGSSVAAAKEANGDAKKPAGTGATDRPDGGALHACLQKAGVESVISTDKTWTDATVIFQKRLTPEPACVAMPKTKDQVAAALKCARENKVKANPLTGRHSFQALGMGSRGNLVIDMGAFTEIKVDERTSLVTVGGGTRVAPLAHLLWHKHQMHTPHARGCSVGVAGSTMGGGFGSTSRMYGAAMDNLKAVELMLANGTIVKADDGHELLWAAKGAGPQFGIVLSMTVQTYRPKPATVANLTLNLGKLEPEKGSEAFMAVQDFLLSPECPDAFALRWGLGKVPNFQHEGYWYDDPDKLDAAMKPLMDKLATISKDAKLSKTEMSWWDMEKQVAGPCMDLPGGGELGGRSFFTQSLVFTSDKPPTLGAITTLHKDTVMAFKREDLKKSGFLDAWAGKANGNLKESDSAMPHDRNLWLFRFEANHADGKPGYPADGIEYMKELTKPFQEALCKDGVKFRGYVNYADTSLKQAEWNERLYGENVERLTELKARYDPDGLFVNNEHAIPVGKTKTR